MSMTCNLLRVDGLCTNEAEKSGLGKEKNHCDRLRLELRCKTKLSKYS